MPAARTLQLLRVPTGPAVLDLLPQLAAMLRGEGPALLPVPADDPTAAADLGTALRAGAALAAGEDDPDDPTALVMSTSGSTGGAKGALLPVGALRASADATRRYLKDGNGPSVAAPSGQWLLALPAHHIAGLQVLLRSLAEGSAPTVLDTGIPFTAARFTDCVAQLSAGPRFTSLVPTQLHRVLADVEATAALASFDAVLVGGAATPPVMLERARAAGIAVVTTYGMSETCGGCVYDGVALDQVAVGIDSPEESVPGQVSITGPMVARGYRGQPGHPAFQPAGTAAAQPASSNPNRTFHTGDLAVVDGPRIRIVGRVDDVIVSGGLKIDPTAVEAVLARVSGVTEVVVTSVPDPEWGAALVAAVVPAPGGPGPLLAALRRAVEQALGPAAAPKHLLVLRELPMRSIGKPDRRAVADLARQRILGD